MGHCNIPSHRGAESVLRLTGRCVRDAKGFSITQYVQRFICHNLLVDGRDHANARSESRQAVVVAQHRLLVLLVLATRSAALEAVPAAYAVILVEVDR